jgi:DNA-binding transcriptional ArsR family regulator
LHNHSVEHIFNSVVDNKSTEAEEALSRVFHCLADPSRRRILALLRESSELRVGDIAKAFDMSLNGVSKHLKVLEAAGLVQRRVEGRVHFLRVNWTALQPAYEFLHFYHHFWSERLDGLIDYAKAKKTTQTAKPRKKKKQ